MTDDKKYDLLLDLARLVKKYGFEVFKDLSADLSSPIFKEIIAELLLKIGNLSEETGIIKSTPTITKHGSRSFRSKLMQIQEEQPEKGKLLLNLFDELSANNYLPTLRDINCFIADNGLMQLHAKSRKSAIIPFVKQFLNLEASDIKRIISDIRPHPKGDDRSLEGWSEIILKRKPKNF